MAAKNNFLEYIDGNGDPPKQIDLLGCGYTKKIHRRKKGTPTALLSKIRTRNLE